MLVGKEAFCDYRTIREAVEALERDASMKPATLYILAGRYEEQVVIYRPHLRIVGIGDVEIAMNRYAKERDEHGEEVGTFATPTLFLGGSHLVVENLTISNTAGQGETIGQAVAVYAHCDQTVFRNCTLKGHQDTLFTGPLPPAPRERAAFGGISLREHHAHYRQFYRNCYIEGTVDFIFGGATAVFEACEIRSLVHEGGGVGYITAASTPLGQKYGYVFRDCFLTAEPGVPEASVYLGRPWREYAQTVFIHCLMGEHIHPGGWDNWNNPANEATVRYLELGTGTRDAGRLRSSRVPWAGWIEDAEADHEYRPEHVFSGTGFWRQGRGFFEISDPDL
ncbi:pectin methylesterase [Paenibacillus oralis]|uniref:Pectinesterase n=1 Tax=Paenibacillus oralis TaxID=2490856 RepID=A0A3P3U9F0_9BACL|nr:pectinesterase family protein [Paenibacillus oralis]RRJ65083.1 pectin methylesterase [Paenibacillus oralis]